MHLFPSTLASRDAVHVEYRWRVSDGSYRWFADHAANSGRDDQIIGTWTDITARKLMRAFDEPFDVDGHELRITPSMGISIYPRDGEDVSTLVKNADTATYRAKGQGRNNYQFYIRELTKQALERITMEARLGRALAQDELELYYQPQLSLRSRTVIGTEALLRWKHPELGLLTPDKFITLAEESGLIIPIGEWVLQSACRDFLRWKALGLP